MNEAEPLPHQAPPVAAKYPAGSVGLGFAIGMLLLLLALQVAFGVLVGVAAELINHGKPAHALLAATIAVGNIFCFAAVIWLGLKQSRVPWRRVIALGTFRPLLLAPPVPAVMGLGILASDGENLTRALGLEPEFFRVLGRELHQGGMWSLAALLLVAPISEELFFRGVLLTGFLRRYGPVRAVLFSAILFGVIHLNPVQVETGFVLGIFLGWLFLRTRSLWPCIAMHAIFNANQFVIPFLCQQLHITIRGFTGSAIPGVVEFQPVWFDALGAVLIVLGVYGVWQLTRAAISDATDLVVPPDESQAEPTEILVGEVNPPAGHPS